MPRITKAMAKQLDEVEPQAFTQALHTQGQNPEKAADLFKRQADMMFNDSNQGAPRVPLLYMDPLLDPLLFLYPKGDSREALKQINTRLRHYYETHRLIGNLIDLHSMAEGEVVYTQRGIVPIEEVTLQDKVINSNGEYQNVLMTDKHMFAGDVYTFRASGALPLTVTDKHPIKTVKGIFIKDGNKERWEPDYKTEKWVFAKQVSKEDYFVIPRYCYVKEPPIFDLAVYIKGVSEVYSTSCSNQYGKNYNTVLKCHDPRPYTVKADTIVFNRDNISIPRNLTVTPDLCELAGWYVAEGYNSNQNIAFCLHSQEKQQQDRIIYLINKIFGVTAYKREFSYKQATQVVLCNALVARWFAEHFGRGAKNKQVPDWLLGSNIKNIKSFIKSYFEGDGTRKTVYDTLACTVSKTLAYQLQLLANKCGFLFTLRTQLMKSGSILYTLSCPHKRYEERILNKEYKQKRAHHSVYFEDKSNFYIRVKDISINPYMGFVYDIKTPDKSFLSSFVIHNSEFPVSDFELRTPVPEVTKYYNDFKNRIGLLGHIICWLKDFWLLGESFSFGIWDPDNRTWKSFNQYPPEAIEVRSTYVGGEHLYFLYPDDDPELKRICLGTDEYSVAIKKSLPPEFVDAVVKGKPILLDSSRLIHFARKPNNYARRGVSIVRRAIKDLMYEDKLRTLQLTFVDRHMFPIKLFKLGDRALGWIPSKKHFANFQSMLGQAANDPDFSIVYHFGIEVDYIGTKDKIANLIPEFEFVEKAILIALFANDTVIHGDMSSYAGQAISMRVLLNRYLTIRTQLEIVLKNKIFLPLAVENDFKDKEGNWILPEYVWEKTNLLSNTTQQDFVMRLRDKGDVPMDLVCDIFGWDKKSLEEQLKNELGTIWDPVWRGIYESKAKDKNIAQQIFEGKKIEDWEKEDKVPAAPLPEKPAPGAPPPTEVPPAEKTEEMERPFIGEPEIT